MLADAENGRNEENIWTGGSWKNRERDFRHLVSFCLFIKLFLAAGG